MLRVGTVSGRIDHLLAPSGQPLAYRFQPALHDTLVDAIALADVGAFFACERVIEMNDPPKG